MIPDRSLFPAASTLNTSCSGRFMGSNVLAQGRAACGASLWSALLGDITNEKHKALIAAAGSICLAMQREAVGIENLVHGRVVRTRGCEYGPPIRGAERCLH